jgi:cell division protein FtsL
MATTSKRNWLATLIGGSFLTEDAFQRQTKLIVLCVVLTIVFISNRYSCMKKLTRIEQLKTELQDVKYENLVISTELTTNTRRSQIEDLLSKKGIDLGAPRTTVYKIEK